MKPYFRLFAFLLLSAPVLAAATRPNILFVLVDDMGWGDLGVFHQNERSGDRKFSTPHLDELALGGIQLRRHYCPAPVCAPSRASLLLGVHQGHANIRNNQFDKTLEDNHTLGTVIKQAGYATACIGKWGLQGPGPAPSQPSRPAMRGFDYFFGYLSHRAAHFHYPEQFSGADDQQRKMGFFENTTDITSDLANCYSTDLITARAKKWVADHVEASPTQPFFLYLAHAVPHARLDVPTQAYPPGSGLTGGLQWTGKSGSMINTASGEINSWIHPDYAKKPWNEAAKRYATMMRRLDDAIGDLLATLKDLKIEDNTLVVFTSDNGAANEAGFGGTVTADPRFFTSYGPLAGIKRDVLEGGIRVPTLVRWPAAIPAGRLTNNPSQFHDWLPTFAAAAGIPVPARSDGVSLLPTLTGKDGQKPSSIYVEYAVNGNTPNYPDFKSHQGKPRGEMQALFLRGYKGIRTNIGSHDDDFRIHDTLADPAEATNLAGRPEVPSQDEFKNQAARMRRASASAARPYIDSVDIPAVAVEDLVNGLAYHVHEAEVPWVPDWSTMTPVRSGVAASPDLSLRSRDKDIGLHFSGYLEIPAEGEYTFHLKTDTGAFVRLHDMQLIDADAGYQPLEDQSSGTIKLGKGYHPIHLHYRHSDAPSHTLELRWSGPGIEREIIPESGYFRPQ